MIGFLFLLPAATAFDLVTAYQSALQYNADYQAQIAGTDALAEVEVQGLAQFLPNLMATTSYKEVYLSSFGHSVYYNQPSVGASLQQVVFDSGKYARYSKSKLVTNVGDLQLLNAREQLIVNVAGAYFDVLYANDNLVAVRINKQAFKEQADQAKISFEIGTVTAADVNDALANYDSATAQEIQAQNDLINKKNILHNMIGLNPDLVEPLADKISLVLPVPESAEAWSDMARQANLNIRIAQANLEMAAEDIKVSKSGHIPTINLVGTYQYQGDININGADSPQTQAIVNQLINIPGLPISNYTNAGIGLQLSLPIFAGGGINSQVRQSIASYETAHEQLISTQRQTDQEIKNAYYQVLNGVSNVKAQTQALKSAKIKLDSDKISYKAGLRDSVDLVNAQKNYAQTLLNYNQARYQYLTYQLQLEYLAGKIDEAYLRLINSNIKSSSL